MSIIPALPTPIPPYTPLSNITPFTYRDGLTYLEVLEQIRVYVNKVIENEGAQNEHINSVLSEHGITISEMLSQLIGYTIEVTDDTYTAAMMDGSEFTAYTLTGTDNRITAAEQTIIGVTQGMVGDEAQRVDQAMSDESQRVDQAVTDLGDTLSDAIAQETSARDTAIQNEVTRTNNLVQNTFDSISEQSWEFSEGTDNVSLGIAQEFATTNGDVFNSEAALRLRFVDQATTSTPGYPGYNQGEIYLDEDGARTAAIRLVTNRIYMNRRLEIDTGGTSRVSIRGGEGESEVATIGFHNRQNRFTLTSENHTAPNLLTTHGIALTVNNSNNLPNPFMVESRQDGVGSNMSTRVSHVISTGAAIFRHYYQNAEVGRVAFEPRAGTNVLRLQADAVEVSGPLDVITDLILRSPNGTRYNLRVDNGGNVIATAR